LARRRAPGEPLRFQHYEKTRNTDAAGGALGSDAAPHAPLRLPCQVGLRDKTLVAWFLQPPHPARGSVLTIDDAIALRRHRVRRTVPGRWMAAATSTVHPCERGVGRETSDSEGPGQVRYYRGKQVTLSKMGGPTRSTRWLLHRRSLARRVCVIGKRHLEQQDTLSSSAPSRMPDLRCRLARRSDRRTDLPGQRVAHSDFEHRLSIGGPSHRVVSGMLAVTAYNKKASD